MLIIRHKLNEIAIRSGVIASLLTCPPSKIRLGADELRLPEMSIGGSKSESSKESNFIEASLLL